MPVGAPQTTSIDQCKICKTSHSCCCQLLPRLAGWFPWRHQGEIKPQCVMPCPTVSWIWRPIRPILPIPSAKLCAQSSKFAAPLSNIFAPYFSMFTFQPQRWFEPNMFPICHDKSIWRGGIRAVTQLTSTNVRMPVSHQPCATLLVP